jgi:hypothetical protein
MVSVLAVERCADVALRAQGDRDGRVAEARLDDSRVDAPGEANQILECSLLRIAV